MRIDISYWCMGIDGVGSFPTAGGCDDSGESDWPTANTRSKQFR